MRKQKNNLDEMQEQKLLTIEHHGVWFAFWGLLATILVQTFVLEEAVWRSIAGEWIVFMCLCVYMGFSCIKNGIWDRTLRPNGKTNLFVSLGSALAFGLLFSISSYVKYDKLLGSICTGVFIFFSVFALTLAALTISALLCKKRLAKIEGTCDEP